MQTKDFIVVEENYKLSKEEFIEILTSALKLRGNTDQPCFCCGPQTWRDDRAIRALLVYQNGGKQEPFTPKGHWGCWFSQTLLKFYGIENNDAIIHLHGNKIKWCLSDNREKWRTFS